MTMTTSSPDPTTTPTLSSPTYLPPSKLVDGLREVGHDLRRLTQELESVPGLEAQCEQLSSLIQQLRTLASGVSLDPIRVTLWVDEGVVQHMTASVPDVKVLYTSTDESIAFCDPSDLLCLSEDGEDHGEEGERRAFDCRIADHDAVHTSWLFDAYDRHVDRFKD